MTLSKLLEQTNITKIGEKPVVILPLAIWEALEDRLEDLEASRSSSLKKKVADARLEKKLYPPSQAKRFLGI